MRGTIEGKPSEDTENNVRPRVIVLFYIQTRMNISNVIDRLVRLSKHKIILEDECGRSFEFYRRHEILDIKRSEIIIS